MGTRSRSRPALPARPRGTGEPAIGRCEAGGGMESIVPGVAFEQETDGGSDDGLDTSTTEACRVLVSVVAVSVFLLVGSWVLSAFELDAENQAVADAVAEMLAFKEKYSVTDEDFQALVDTAGTPVELGDDGSWVASSHRHWNLQSDLILFAWTILSTIGYGNFAPSTVHAQPFLFLPPFLPAFLPSSLKPTHTHDSVPAFLRAPLSVHITSQLNMTWLCCVV